MFEIKKKLCPNSDKIEKCTKTQKGTITKIKEVQIWNKPSSASRRCLFCSLALNSFNCFWLWTRLWLLKIITISCIHQLSWEPNVKQLDLLFNWRCHAAHEVHILQLCLREKIPRHETTKKKIQTRDKFKIRSIRTFPCEELAPLVVEVERSLSGTPPTQSSCPAI